MSEFVEGTTFVTDDGERLWQLQDIEVTYEVQTRPAGDDGDSDDVESMRYPETVLQDKLERGELEVIEEPDDDVPDDPVSCETCGGGPFEGVIGLRQHRRQVHPDEPELPDGMKLADSS